MLLYLYLLPLLGAFGPAKATPTQALEPRGASQCGQYTSVSTGTFTIATKKWSAPYGKILNASKSTVIVAVLSDGRLHGHGPTPQTISKAIPMSSHPPRLASN